MLMLLSLATVAALRLDVTPVEKVITLLEDLRNQVQEEGSEEAANYDKFACFCKNTNDEKVKSIQEGETSVETLTGELVELEAKKEELMADISALETSIAQLEADLKKATEIREQEHAVYEVEFADASAAVDALAAAIGHLEASKSGPGLVEVKAAVQKTLALADALNIKPKNPTAVAAFLQQPFEDGKGEYEFHSGGIVDTLNDLLAKFKDQKNKLEEEENRAQSAFDTAAKAKREEIETSKTSLDTKKGELEETTSTIAQKTEELTETKAQLADDKTYLKDLTGQCEVKATEWDQRSKMRADELSAIGQALEIITGTVQGKAEKTGAGGRGEAAALEGDAAAAEGPPKDVFLRKAAKHSRRSTSLTQQDDEAEAEDYTDVVFVQTGAEASKLRNRVIAVLKLDAQKLKSAALALLVMKLAADPFAKVKVLIQQLIERLLRESADEATQKGWCDTEIGKAEKDREYRHSDMMELNAAITSGEATRAALEQTIEELTAAIADLNEKHTEAQKLRLEAKATNKQTMDNAREGLDALNQAIEVLKNFYKQAGRAKVFIQASPVSQDLAAEGADAGFSGAYKGNQAQGQGVIGVLETIASDFERTLQTTEAQEAAEHRAWIDFDRETKASLSTKETGLKQSKEDLMRNNADLAQNLQDLKGTQEMLDASLETLEKLRPACVDTGMSFEERVKRREAEIEALKKALEILSENDK